MNMIAAHFRVSHHRNVCPCSNTPEECRLCEMLYNRTQPHSADGARKFGRIELQGKVAGGTSLFLLPPPLSLGGRELLSGFPGATKKESGGNDHPSSFVREAAPSLSPSARPSVVGCGGRLLSNELSVANRPTAASVEKKGEKLLPDPCVGCRRKRSFWLCWFSSSSCMWMEQQQTHTGG